jgi:inorganic pyrophosphatase
MMPAMDTTLRLGDWAGRRIEIVIDRPLGSLHPREPDLRYEVNYGYVPGTLAPDGHPLDVYVLGTSEPMERCVATVIAIVRRRDDVEDKLVAVIDGAPLEGWDAEGIALATWFQERWFDTWIEVGEGRAAGVE